MVLYPTIDNLSAHVVCIMDYPSGDPAQGDIMGLIVNWFGPNAQRTWFTVDDFSATEIGYLLASRRIINGDRIYPFTAVLANAAPRERETLNLEAAPFITFKLKNGVRVFTTLNSEAQELEYINLDYVDGAIQKLKLKTEGTQFRSLSLPEIAARYFLAEGKDANSEEGLASMVEEGDLRENIIKTLQVKRPVRVCHIDNFGNIKLSTCEGDDRALDKIGSKIEVTISGVTNTLYRGKHLGDVKNDKYLCLYPGSDISYTGRKFLEICLTGKSAAHLFKNEDGLSRLGDRVRSGSEVFFNYN